MILYPLLSSNVHEKLRKKNLLIIMNLIHTKKLF